MSNMKFVCRETELSSAKESLKSNATVVMRYFDDSGLSHFLKKLQWDLLESNAICFYIDCESAKSMSHQIIEQIFASYQPIQNRVDSYLKNKRKTEVVKACIKKITGTLKFNLLPFVNLDQIIKNLIDAMCKTADTDIEHLSDYKLDKAIIELFHTFERENSHNGIYILYDTADCLKTIDLSSSALVMSNTITKFLFAISQKNESVGDEIVSKMPNYSAFGKIDKTFDKPDNRLIRCLFTCYNRDFREEYIDVFERYDRNIHKIMAYVKGFQFDFGQLDYYENLILKILFAAENPLKTDLLKRVFRKSLKRIRLEESAPFDSSLKKLVDRNCVEYIDDDRISVKRMNVTRADIKLNSMEELVIANDILKTFDESVVALSEEQIKYVIGHSDRDYSREKAYVMLLVNKQKDKRCVEIKYLNRLNSFESKRELFAICALYCNEQVYDRAYAHLVNHRQWEDDRTYRLLMAFVKERLHKDDYYEYLVNLASTSKCLDEKCLLLSIIFVAAHNTGNTEHYKKILFDDTDADYYKNFSSSVYYSYLLRNVSYYFTDVREGIEKYNQCLAKFKGSDPVNYNRTMSNFVCYLLKNRKHPLAKAYLDEREVPVEIDKILDYNDAQYVYLNINYGIYLMTYGKGNPVPYFDAIIFEKSTTETPYIYSRINKAMYIAQKNPQDALLEMDEIYSSHISSTKVIPTKKFYNINRILVEYMNGLHNTEILEDIYLNPIRGDEEYAERLYDAYSQKFANNIEYSGDFWEEAFLPGYIFYRSFDAELLLSNFANPSLTI